MGKKRHSFFGELRRESQWGRCFPIATKGCSQTTLHLCFRRALTQFPSLYSSKYLIYCCVTFPSAKAKMRNGFKAGLRYFLIQKWKSGIQHSTEGETTFNFLSTELAWSVFNYVPTSTVGWQNKTPEACYCPVILSHLYRAY